MADVVTISTKAIPADAVAASATSIRLKIGLPWYRSLPWAGVESVTLDLDGTPLGEPASIDGVTLEGLDSREDYWFIQRWAVAEFANPLALRPGIEVDARVRVRLRIPGPLLPDGSPMPFVFDETRRVVVADASSDESEPETPARRG